jgi:hypothetical protein
VLLDELLQVVQDLALPFRQWLHPVAPAMGSGRPNFERRTSNFEI